MDNDLSNFLASFPSRLFVRSQGLTNMTAEELLEIIQNNEH